MDRSRQHAGRQGKPSWNAWFVARRWLFAGLLLPLWFQTTHAQADVPATEAAGRRFRWVLEVANPNEVGAGIKQFIFATSLELRQNGVVIQKCKVSGDHVLEFTLTKSQVEAGTVDLVGTCRRCCQDRGIHTFHEQAIPLRHRKGKVGLHLVWGDNI